MRKVAIIGTAPDSLHFAPWEDESWEVWSLAGNFNQIPRMDRWFEFHPWPENPARPRPWEIGGGWPSDKARMMYMEWLSERQGGLVVAHPCPQMPGAVPYPLEAIIEAFSSRYFTNSVAWMIALAIWEGVDVIGLWGVDMSLSTEYGHQRPSCEYFIGMARGRGIPVVIPHECDLLKARRLYGFEPPSEIEDRIRARLETTRYRQQDYENKKIKAMLDEAAMSGHIEALEWVSTNLESSHEVPDHGNPRTVHEGPDPRAEARERLRVERPELGGPLQGQASRNGDEGSGGDGGAEAVDAEDLPSRLPEEVSGRA